MKKSITILAVLLLLPLCSVFGQKWNFDYVDPEHSEQAAMTMDSNGNLHVAYYKTSGWPWNTNYAKQTSNGWEVQTVAASNGMQSIAVDSETNPHITFISSDYALDYATLKNGQWQVTKIDSTDMFFDNYIQVDANNHVHVSYVGNTPNHYLKYAFYDGNAWQFEKVDTSGMVGDGCVMAIDGQNRPHIVYGDGKNNTIKYCYWDGSLWQITQFEMNQYHYGWLVLDQNDQPCISCTNDNNEFVYLTFDGTQWTEEIIQSPPDGTEIGKWNSMCFDNSGIPVFAFGWTNNWFEYYVYYVFKDGNEWKMEPVDTLEAINDLNATIVRIVADKQNNLHIVYNFKGSSARGIKHATTGSATGFKNNQQSILPGKIELLQNYPNPFNATTTISYQLPVNSYVSLIIYDGTGKKIRTLLKEFQAANAYTINWNGKDDWGRVVSSGVYYYQLKVRNSNNSFVQIKKMILLK